MRSTKQQRWTWLRPIRVFLTILIIFDFVGLPVGVLQLFNGAYVIGTASLYGVFPQGIPTFTQSHMSFGGVQLMWHPTGAFQILMFGLSHGLGLIVATLPMLITLANRSILKNGRARAIRFSTLTAPCEVLQCQPGDLFTVRPGRRDP